MGAIVGNILIGLGLAALVLVVLVAWENWPRKARPTSPEKLIRQFQEPASYAAEVRGSEGLKQPSIPDPGPYQRRQDTTRR